MTAMVSLCLKYVFEWRATWKTQHPAITAYYIQTECDGCTYASLVDLEKLDDGLVLLKQQLQNISHGPASVSRLNKLDANTSKVKVSVDGVVRYCICENEFSIKSSFKSLIPTSVIFVLHISVFKCLSPLFFRFWLGGTGLLWDTWIKKMNS